MGCLGLSSEGVLGHAANRPRGLLPPRSARRSKKLRRHLIGEPDTVLRTVENKTRAGHRRCVDLEHDRLPMPGADFDRRLAIRREMYLLTRTRAQALALNGFEKARRGPVEQHGRR